MRKTLTIAAVAALLFAGPAAASAAEGDEPTNDPYTPTTPFEPTLTGSTVTGVCDNDAPYISVNIQLTDPNGIATSNVAHLVLSDSQGNTIDLLLGELDENGNLQTTILWPGATVDEEGNATGWPGWAEVNGELVQTTGNFAWTRGSISAMIQVNPELPVPLSYPPATPLCNAGPHGTTTTPAGSGGTSVTGSGLAQTGVSPALLPIGVGAGLLALVGTGQIVGRRLAKR
nr:cell wall protein [Agromyces seonyuensis]